MFSWLKKNCVLCKKKKVQFQPWQEDAIAAIAKSYAGQCRDRNANRKRVMEPKRMGKSYAEELLRKQMKPGDFGPLVFVNNEDAFDKMCRDDWTKPRVGKTNLQLNFGVGGMQVADRYKSWETYDIAETHGEVTVAIKGISGAALRKGFNVDITA